MESLTRPFFHHRRKLSNASISTTTNGLSFSGKDFYDDVFAGGGPKPKFGGAAGGGGSSGFSSRRVAAQDYAEIFGGRNGTRGSSIPVLDLSDLDERNGSSDFRSSDKEMDYSAIFGGFGVGGGGDDNEVAAMAVPPYEELFNGFNKGKTDKAKTKMSAGISSSLKGSEDFNSSENSKSHLSEASDQIFDGGKQFNMSYHKTGQQRKDGLNGTTHIAEFHAVPGFTYVIDETARLQKIEQDKAKLPIKAEVQLNRSSSDFLQKTELEKAKPPVKLEVGHNINSRDCLQKIEQEKAKPPFRPEVNDNKSSSDHLQKTEQVKAMPPMPSVNLDVNHNKNSNDNISEGKSGKRAKWQLPTTQATESLVKDKGEHSQHASHSRDKLFDADECDQKSEHSEVPSTSSSSANLNDNSKKHPKQSESSSYAPKFEDPEKVTCGSSTPFSDEELDENSAAAASAAALKKAIEQAQESIRIAKEIMERKRNSVQGSKSRSTYSLKAEDRMEIKHVEEAKNTGENNLKEACESIDNKVVGFSGINHNIGLRSGEVASSLNHIEKPSTGIQVDMVMNCENVEVAEENGLAMWFTQLLNNGKHRMAALASELVGKKNSISQPLDKDVHDILETKPSKVTLECGVAEKVHAVDRNLEFGDTDAKLNAVDRILEFWDTDVKLNELGGPEELEKHLDNSNSSLFAREDRVCQIVFAQEDEVSDNIKHGSDKGEESEKEFEDCHVTISDRQFELEQLGNALSEDESVKLEQKAIDQELEKKLEDTHVWEVNDCRVDVEIDKKQEECHLLVGNEDEPQTASGYISNGKTQEDNPQERYHMQETDEQRSTQSVDEQENQIMMEEEHAWEEAEGRPAWTCQDKESESGDEDADYNSANEKMENQEVQNVGNIRAEKEGSAENPRENLFQHAFYGEGLNTAGDANIFDQSANSDDTQETCRFEIENFNEQTNELKTGDHEEKDNLAGFMEQTIQPEGSNNEERANNVEVSECSYEFEENVKAQEAVEEASRLKGKQTLETTSVDHGNAQENIIQSNHEAVASDDQSIDFGFTNINLEAESSKNTDTVRSLIHNGTEEDAIDSDDGTESPCAVQNSSDFDFTDMKQTQKSDGECESSINSENCNGSAYESHTQNQLEESDEESESDINPETGDNLFHESAQNAKVDDIASEKETAKVDIEIRHEERECIENENEQESSHVSRELERQEHVGTDHGMKTCHENEEELEYSQFPRELEGEALVESNPDMKMGQSTENNEDVSKNFVKEGKETRENVQKEEVGKDYRKSTEVNKTEREKEKDRIAVERAIREARERAFAEARERAERAAVEKATAEVRQRAMAEAREKLEKASAGTKVATDKASTEAKLRAERAAVERATAEARERALEKALSQKNISETRMQAERNVSGKFPGVSRDGGLKHSFSSSDLETCDGSNSESAQRRKARLERHQRIMERAAKALAEKNLRDVLAQREQAEKNRLAETLDADIKRWASGKEGNLRALLSTLQYILGPGSGWQPIPLTEIITTNAVKKAYRKATLYVHPDKLQQRGASIQQKYICEKVFDLLKAAWNKFNSEER